MGGRQLVSGRAVRRRIAALDPVDDHEEVARLSLEVRLGDALFVHLAYTVAFARQVAIPSIARVVHRRGTGDMMRAVRTRNDHTLLFFGEMIRNGHTSPAGRAAIDRMEEIHSRFGITDDDKLFTLASLALEARRVTDGLGIAVYTGAEDTAQFLFWKGVGEYMGLTVPATRTAFTAWSRDYERAHAGYTDGGRALVDQLFADWHRWFPGPLRRFADPLLLLALGADLRAVHRLPEPPAWLAARPGLVLRPYVLLQDLRPHDLRRTWVEHFGGHRGEPLDLAALGHRGPSGRSGTAAVSPAV